MQINFSHFTPNKCLYLWQAENDGAGLYFSIKGQDDRCVCFNEFCLGCAGSSLLRWLSLAVESRGYSLAVVRACYGARALGRSGFSGCGRVLGLQWLWRTGLVAPR